MTTISIDAIPIYATALTISLNVSRASSRPSFQLSVNIAELGTTATIGAVNIPPGFFDNTPAINLLSSPGLTESRGELIWQPDMRGTTILSVAVSGTPSSQNTTLRITAAGYQVRASVDATLLARGSGRDLLFYTMNKILITLPPTRTSRSFALTITQDLDDIRVSIIMDPSGILGEMMGSFVSFTNIRRGAIAYTITIVEFSEADEMTLYAQAVMPFDMPGFSPPSFPQMPKLAFADPVIPAPAPQGRESNIPTPPLAAAKGANAPVIKWRFAPSAFAALRRVDSRLRGNDNMRAEMTIKR